uniref:UspA domain-containing protein n=1 Tax=Schistocephalus solidus TaxID=70667 RepID=A0A0X3P260_SCHSO
MATQNTKRKILFPVDSSANCERAFRWFLANLLQPQDVLYFFHIIEPVYSTPAVGLGMESPPLLIDDMTRVMKESVVTGKKACSAVYAVSQRRRSKVQGLLAHRLETRPGDCQICQ